MATDHRATGERTSDEQRIAEELGSLLGIDPENLHVEIRPRSVPSLYVQADDDDDWTPVMFVELDE